MESSVHRVFANSPLLINEKGLQLEEEEEATLEERGLAFFPNILSGGRRKMKTAMSW